MLSADQLQKKWEQRALLFPFDPAMTFTEAGLVLGAGTVLAACRTDRRGRATFAIDSGEKRI